MSKQSMPRPLRRACGVLALAGLAWLGGCSVVPEGSPEAGRARVIPPRAVNGAQWVDLGGGELSFDNLDDALPAPALPTRVMGLRGTDPTLLAVVVVQSNRSGLWQDRHTARNSCPPERGVHVEDATGHSPTRVDCLRFKRWADGHNWLAQRYPRLSGYLGAQQALPQKPFGALDFRYNTEAGGYVSVQMLVNRRLIEPVTRGNGDFLVAGRPADAWVQRVAQAARLSAASIDGALHLPDFPFPVPQ